MCQFSQLSVLIILEEKWRNVLVIFASILCTVISMVNIMLFWKKIIDHIFINPWNKTSHGLINYLEAFEGHKCIRNSWQIWIKYTWITHYFFVGHWMWIGKLGSFEDLIEISFNDMGSQNKNQFRPISIRFMTKPMDYIDK